METAECCQDGSLVMPAGQRWLTKVKGEGKLLCTIAKVEQWTTTVYMAYPSNTMQGSSQRI